MKRLFYLLMLFCSLQTCTKYTGAVTEQGAIVTVDSLTGWLKVWNFVDADSLEYSCLANMDRVEFIIRDHCDNWPAPEEKMHFYLCNNETKKIKFNNLDCLYHGIHWYAPSPVIETGPTQGYITYVAIYAEPECINKIWPKYSNYLLLWPSYYTFEPGSGGGDEGRDVINVEYP